MAIRKKVESSYCLQIEEEFHIDDNAFWFDDTLKDIDSSSNLYVETPTKEAQHVKETARCQTDSSLTSLH